MLWTYPGCCKVGSVIQGLYKRAKEHTKSGQPLVVNQRHKPEWSSTACTELYRTLHILKCEYQPDRAQLSFSCASGHAKQIKAPELIGQETGNLKEGFQKQYKHKLTTEKGNLSKVVKGRRAPS